MISEAASTGDRRKTLEAMRDKLARDMDDAPPAVVAQIAGRLSAILAELDDLPSAERKSSFDELATRRQDRIAAPAATEAPRKQERQRRA